MDWFYQGIENYKYISIRNFTIRLLSLVLIFLIIKRKEDYVLYGLIWVLGTLVSSISNFSYSFKFASLQIKYLKIKNLFNHLVRSLPTTILSWMGFIYATIDTIMLGIMIQDDKYSVGLYNVAGRIIRIVLSIIISISTVLLPRFSYLSEAKDYDHLNDILLKGTYLIMYIAIPCFIGIFCISDNIILIFAGNKFENSITTLKILSFELIFVSIRSILSNYLYAISKEKKLVVITISSLLLAIILNALLIPPFKQNGAATATIICMFIESILLIRASRNIVFHSKEWKTLIKIVVVNILFLLGLFILIFILNQYHLIYSTLLIIFSSILLYLTLSIIFRLEPYRIISEWFFMKVKETCHRKNTL
jgi:O-antigen/teichoic acid export membrane protein